MCQRTEDALWKGSFRTLIESCVCTGVFVLAARIRIPSDKQGYAGQIWRTPWSWSVLTLAVTVLSTIRRLILRCLTCVSASRRVVSSSSSSTAWSSSSSSLLSRLSSSFSQLSRNPYDDCPNRSSGLVVFWFGSGRLSHVHVILGWFLS